MFGTSAPIADRGQGRSLSGAEGAGSASRGDDAEEGERGMIKTRVAVVIWALAMLTLQGFIALETHRAAEAADDAHWAVERLQPPPSLN